MVVCHERRVRTLSAERGAEINCARGLIGEPADECITGVGTLGTSAGVEPAACAAPTGQALQFVVVCSRVNLASGLLPSAYSLTHSPRRSVHRFRVHKKRSVASNVSPAIGLVVLVASITHCLC